MKRMLESLPYVCSSAIHVGVAGSWELGAGRWKSLDQPVLTRNVL